MQPSPPPVADQKDTLTPTLPEPDDAPGDCIMGDCGACWIEVNSTQCPDPLPAECDDTTANGDFCIFLEPFCGLENITDSNCQYDEKDGLCATGTTMCTVESIYQKVNL